MCFSIGIDNKSIVLIYKAYKGLNFVCLYMLRPLGHGFQLCRIHLDFVTIDDMHLENGILNMEFTLDLVAC